MNMPECPLENGQCRFTIGPTSTYTNMNDQIVYNRDGMPVGGGRNIIRQHVKCLECNKMWTSSRTALDAARGSDHDWKAM